MLAIEGSRDRFGQGLLAGKVRRQHRAPSDGLQRGPMQTRREDERKDDQKFSKTRKHETKILPD